MKLTRKQIVHLGLVLSHLERAQKFLAASDVEVCKVGNFASTTLHFVNPNQPGKTLYPICKDIGSDLTGLPEGIRLLKELL